jgi:predicted ATP-grasp superfamily ATP-dependent carboligase
MTLASDDSPNVVIVGASARAAAFSAVRAGMRPWCADLFADLDLQEIAPVTILRGPRYAAALPRLLQQAPPGPCVYLGGLENWPDIIRRIGRSRTLWGNEHRVLEQVRQPWNWANVLKQAGCAVPQVRQAANPPPRDGRWLAKPLHSAGGQGIQRWMKGTRIPSRKQLYFQEFLHGESCAAVYLGDGRGAALLGVTRQLVGEAWLNAPPFHYCGSIGPLALSGPLNGTFTLLGNVLASEFELRGLFGVDCIQRGDEIYPVEINPRYTASVEVLEHALGLTALRMHRAIFATSGSVADIAAAATGDRVGKAVLFAPARLTVPPNAPWNDALTRAITGWRDYADIPHPGEQIEQGRPIVTLFCRARTMANAISELQDRACDLARSLFAK